MIYIIESLIILVVFMGFFCVLGKRIVRKQEKSIVENIVVGFFCYYSLFQCVSLPMTFLGGKLSTLSMIWIVFLLCLTIFLLIWQWKNKRSANYTKKINSKVKFGVSEVLMILVSACLVVTLCIQALAAIDNGVDAAHYVGSINNAVYTDKLFGYDGYSGAELECLNLHFALSSFYMHSAVWCQLLNIPVLIFQRYCIGVLGAFIALMIIYLIIKNIIITRKGRILAFLLAVTLMFVADSTYMGEYFLLNRMMQAKTFCAMVICPAVAWSLMMIWKDNTKNNWIILFIIAFASVPLSMSAIFSVPILIAAFSIGMCLCRKDIKNFVYGAVCCAPNFLYAALYLVTSMGMIVIGG